MKNKNFFKFLVELKVKNIENKKFSFILNLYEKYLPNNIEKDLREKFNDGNIYYDYIKYVTSKLSNTGRLVFYSTRRNIENEKEIEIKSFVEKIKELDINLSLKSFDFDFSHNVFSLFIDDKYRLILINNHIKENITLISVFNNKDKKANHFNTVLNYEEFNFFLENYLETLEMNKDLFDMWSI